MYNLEAAYNNISLNDITNKLSEYELWKYYCPNFEDVNKPFRSSLYDDNNPDCRIYYSNGRLMYKDFGSGHLFGIYDYIQFKYSCTFQEALRIIANDFKLSNSDIKAVLRPKIDVLNNHIDKSKSYIEIEPQGFTIADFNYWQQYKIPLELLEEYNVYSCKTVWLIKPDKTIRFEYSRTNPIFAYRFSSNGKYSYKIYFPLSSDKRYKWLFSGGSQNDIEGYDQLSLFGDILILTKSLKDCMVYRLLGYDAISLQGETNRLEGDFVRKLLKRFNQIIINYDNDDEGIKNTNRLMKQYSFKSFYIDDYKDLSDYVKHKDLEQAKQMINNKIQQLEQ